MTGKIMMKYKALSVQVKASIWFTVCAFLQKGISVLTTPIFTRLLTTEEYGQYNVFNSWLGVINTLVSLNLSFSVFAQGLVKFERERKLFFSSMLGLTTALVSVWTVIYLLFARFWNELFSMTTAQMLSMLLMIWTSAVFNFSTCAVKTGKVTYRSCGGRSGRFRFRDRNRHHFEGKRASLMPDVRLLIQVQRG